MDNQNQDKTIQPQAILVNATPLKENITEVTKTVTNQLQTNDKSNEITNQDNIHNKRVYKKFLKQIKGKRAINGVILADILGVARQTIYKWLDTPSAMEILQQNINEYTTKIGNSKDWKASAYLLDKLYNNKDKEAQQINLTNLIQVNTIESNKKDKGDTTL